MTSCRLASSEHIIWGSKSKLPMVVTTSALFKESTIPIQFLNKTLEIIKSSRILLAQIHLSGISEVLIVDQMAHLSQIKSPL